jgi:isoleucyl-tRNA synthetase
VHLADWPSADLLPHDPRWSTAMDRVRQVASSALSLRKSAGLRVRLPLARLTVAAADAESLRPFTDILRDEVNVKEVVLSTDVSAHGRFEVAVNARACGPAAGRGHPEGDPRRQGGGVGAEHRRHRHRRRDHPAGRGSSPRSSSPPTRPAPPRCPAPRGWSCSTPRLTPALAAEGTARDVVRAVQQARRDAGLAVADRIALVLDAPAPVLDAVRAHEEFVAGEVLAVSVAYGPVADGSSVR